MSKYKIEPSPKTITHVTPINLDPNQHKIKDKTFFFKRKKKTKREILIILIPLIIARCLDKHNHKSPSFYDYGQVVSISNLFFHIDLTKDSTIKRSVRKVWESPSILLYSILINCSPPMLERFFEWVYKDIQDHFGFTQPCSVIGPENSRHPLNQSDAKLKTIATWSPAFSRALSSLFVFTSSSHWPMIT